MRTRARLIRAAAAAAVGLLVLARIHAGLVDAGALVLEVAALLTLAHAAFRLLELDELARDGGHDSEEEKRSRQTR